MRATLAYDPYFRYHTRTMGTIDALFIRVLALLLVVLGSSPVLGQISFTDITSSAGVANSLSSAPRVATSATWGDYDDDGDPDLYVTNWASGAAVNASVNRLYRNNGNASFSDVAGQSGVAESRNSIDAAWVDYDGDGDLDIYIVTFDDQDQLYRNNGGSFSRVTASSGVNVISQGDETAVAWGDYDGDGNIDFYLCKRRFRNALYHNNGNGTFSEVGESAGVDYLGDSQDAVWGDYDNDGDLDLYVVNREQSNILYQNEAGQFTEIACDASVDNTDIGNAAAWIDYDGDNDLDLSVANIGANALYRNDGGDTFTNVTAGDLGATATTWITSAAVWEDFDADGDPDVLLVNGANSNAGQTSQLLLQSAGTFTDDTAAAGLSTGGSFGIDAAVVDFDGDGDLDIYLVNSQFPSFEASILYQNDLP